MAAPVAPPTIAPIAAPRPPPIAPPKIAPAAPPRIAPPTGSCAAASCTGAAMAIVTKATAPNDRYIISPQISEIMTLHPDAAEQRRTLAGKAGAGRRTASVDARAATGSGHRRYPRSVLRRIAFIVFAQRIGLAL